MRQLGAEAVTELRTQPLYELLTEGRRLKWLQRKKGGDDGDDDDDDDDDDDGATADLDDMSADES